MLEVFMLAICCLILSCLVMAAVEYWFHRWPMHNLRFIRRFRLGGELFESHAVLHHSRYYQDSFINDPDPASTRISIRMSVLEHLAGSMVVSVPLWLLLSPLAAVCFSAVVGFHALVWTAFHVEMHMPKGRWFSRLRVYRYVRDYHHAHHLYPGKNFAAVFPPLMDMLFGTYTSPVQAPNAERPKFLLPQCKVPPPGWRCTRGAGHEGPCAAVPNGALPK